jgi:transcriptional regulator with XRE-family HTH domain
MPISLEDRFNGISVDQAAKFLKRKRKAKFTQEKFIELIGMNHAQYLSQLENAKVDWRRSDYAPAIIRELGLTRQELLNEAGIGENQLAVIGITPIDGLLPQGLSRLEDHSPTRVFRVWASVSLGDGDSDPTDEAIPIPLDDLPKGARLENIRVFRANGDCMISDDLRRIGESIAHGDKIAVEMGRASESGDVVIAWDEATEKLLVKVYQGQTQDNHEVFYALSSAHPPLVRSIDQITPLGVVVWRGGPVKKRRVR